MLNTQQNIRYCL